MRVHMCVKQTLPSASLFKISKVMLVGPSIFSWILFRSVTLRKMLSASIRSSSTTLLGSGGCRMTPIQRQFVYVQHSSLQTEKVRWYTKRSYAIEKIHFTERIFYTFFFFSEPHQCYGVCTLLQDSPLERTLKNLWRNSCAKIVILMTRLDFKSSIFFSIHLQMSINLNIWGEGGCSSSDLEVAIISTEFSFKQSRCTPK